MKKVNEILDEMTVRRIYHIVEGYVYRYTKKYKIDLTRISREDIIQDNVVIYLESLTSSYRVRQLRFDQYYTNLTKQLGIPIDINIDDIDIRVNDLCDNIVIMSECRDTVDEVLKTLQPRKETIIRKYYGIGDETCQTLVEIGRQINLSGGRTSMLKKNALLNLRHPSRSKRLKDYLEFFNE